VPVSVARQIAGMAFIKGGLHNGETIEQVVHYRPDRYRTAELRTALGLGDPPLFPGVACADCGARYGIQWDHTDPVNHGGPTSYHNVQPLCYPCHAAKTKRDRAAGLLTPQRDRPGDQPHPRPRPKTAPTTTSAAGRTPPASAPSPAQPADPTAGTLPTPAPAKTAAGTSPSPAPAKTDTTTPPAPPAQTAPPADPAHPAPPPPPPPPTPPPPPPPPNPKI
jgi:hypothetical protein